MNRWWKRAATAAIALGLMLCYGADLHAQYPPMPGPVPLLPMSYPHEPTPIGGPGLPEYPISPNMPAPPPQGAPPTLPGYMCSAFDDCENCCSELETNHYFTLDLLVFRPDYDRNPAGNLAQAVPNVGGPGVQEFDRDWQVVPRLTLNAQVLPMWGFRSSWWQLFEDNATLGNLAASDLRMTVVDAEITRYVELGDAYGALSLGVRYAYSSQNYQVTGFNTVGFTPVIPVIEERPLIFPGDNRPFFYGHNISSVGPKLGLNLAFPLGDWVRLYGVLNGSLLMGNRSENGYVHNTAGVPLTTPLTNQEFTVIPVGEVETGFSFQLGNNVVAPLFKLGFVGQYWVGAGNGSNPNANLFLYGVNASLGIGF